MDINITAKLLWGVVERKTLTAIRNGKLVEGFSRNRCFHDHSGKRSSQNRKKKEKEESE